MQTGVKTLEEVCEQIKRYFNESYHTEILICKDEDDEFTITFD